MYDDSEYPNLINLLKSFGYSTNVLSCTNLSNKTIMLKYG